MRPRQEINAKGSSYAPCRPNVDAANNSKTDDTTIVSNHLKTKSAHQLQAGAKTAPTARPWRKVAQRSRRPIIIRVAVAVKMKGFAHFAESLPEGPKRHGRQSLNHKDSSPSQCPFCTSAVSSSLALPASPVLSSLLARRFRASPRSSARYRAKNLRAGA